MLVTQIPNVVEYVAVYLAAARLGVVLSPVPMQYRRGEIEPPALLILSLRKLGARRQAAQELPRHIGPAQ